MLLQSARDQYTEQQKIAASAVLAARRKRRSGARAIAAVLSAHQAESALLTFNSTPDQLAEQGLDAPAAGIASVSALVSGNGAVPLIEATKSPLALDRLVAALVADAGRTAATVDLIRRPLLTGYIRSLVLPSCGRCAVLAGRTYRYSTGFQRHPKCDCLMTPTTLEAGRSLVTDPTAAIESRQIRGLSEGDWKALDNGADLGQVVNVRRKQAGLVIGSSVITRSGRLTPQGIARVASDRAEAIALLRTNGYITAP